MGHSTGIWPPRATQAPDHRVRGILDDYTSKLHYALEQRRWQSGIFWAKKPAASGSVRPKANKTAEPGGKMFERTHLAAMPSMTAGIDRTMWIQVQCYAGYRGEEIPRRIQIGERSLDVIAILDRWLAPDHRYFKCQTADGDQWIIRHDAASERWELTHFKRN
jgi:hypothetical protein